MNKNEQHSFLPKGCIMLIMGLPGSGKSTLVDLIKLNISVQFSNLSINIIKFDDLFSIEEQKRIIEIDNAWKSIRKSIKNSIENFIAIALESNDDYSIDNDHDDNINEHNYRIKNEFEEKILAKIIDLNRDLQRKSEKYLFLIEDNFYLTSMRYEYYQISRKHDLCFCQIHLNKSINTCLLNNERRDEYHFIDSNIIMRMNNSFEHTNFNKNVWEKNSIIFNENDEIIIEKIFTFLQNLFEQEIRIKNSIVDANELETQRKINEKNLIHQVDCLIREIINDEIKECKYQKNILALKLNERKREILINLKNFNYSKWINEQICYCANNCKQKEILCKQFIKELLLN